MLKPLFSCFAGILVAVIVFSMLRTTMRREASAPPPTDIGVLQTAPGSKLPISAFTSADHLTDYLIAGANGDKAAVERLLHPPDCIPIDGGTQARILGYSGAGQARVRILSGPNAGKTLYVSFTVVQKAGRE